MHIIFIIPILKGLYYYLLMLQLDHYKIKSCFNYLKKYYFRLPFTLVTYLSILFIFKNSYLDLLVYIFILVFSLIKIKYIIKLKLTKRMLRLLIINLILIILPFIFSFNKITFLLVLYLIPFIVILSSILIYPFEYLINSYYKNKCTKKLNKINPFIVCITGSFGKTSIKKMLHSIYQPYYITSSTPRSFNTPMGITKHVLTNLNGLCDIFFVEAGATTIGDIKEITKMINPDLGVITSIGPQHLSSFKSIDNVLKTKWELAEGLKEDGKLVLNYGNKYLNGLTASNIKETLGVNKKYGTFYPRNITYNDLYTEFDIYSYDKKIIHIKTKLLGDHNIDNIVICYGVKKMLDDKFYISDNDFKEAILNLTNIENRLSLKEENIDNVTFRYIDDSFNSNVEGFVSACKVLKRLNGIKCIITPGIVDGGKYKESIALSIISSLDLLDDIVLVNNKELKYIKSILNELKIKYKLVNSYKEGLSYLKNKYYDFKNEYIIILIENDLPDNYLMRW